MVILVIMVIQCFGYQNYHYYHDFLFAGAAVFPDLWTELIYLGCFAVDVFCSCGVSRVVQVQPVHVNQRFYCGLSVKTSDHICSKLLGQYHIITTVLVAGNIVACIWIYAVFADKVFGIIVKKLFDLVKYAFLFTTFCATTATVWLPFKTKLNGYDIKHHKAVKPRNQGKI